jgi:hypothetical protein
MVTELVAFPLYVSSHKLACLLAWARTSGPAVCRNAGSRECARLRMTRAEQPTKKR